MRFRVRVKVLQGAFYKGCLNLVVGELVSRFRVENFPAAPKTIRLICPQPEVLNPKPPKTTRLLDGICRWILQPRRFRVSAASDYVLCSLGQFKV